MEHSDLRPTKKKRQHYVPQMMQRRFSNDGRRVNVWDIRNRRMFRDVGLREQLQEKYFYERTEDGFEKALEALEGLMTPLFDAIEESQDLPHNASEDWKFLVLWLVVQVQRTDTTAIPINQFHEEMIQHAAQMLEAEGKIPEGPNGLTLKDLKVTVDPKWGRQNAVALAFEISGTATDLHAGLLHSPNGRVTLPDCGAFRFNLIAEAGGLPWGWASIGAGAILPLSNQNAVVFYDPASYSWLQNRTQVLRVLDEFDEVQLAETLLLRTTNRVVFNSDPDWLVGVDTNLHSKASTTGAIAIAIPGLKPHPPLMELAREPQNRLYGPPPRPTAKLS